MPKLFKISKHALRRTIEGCLWFPVAKFLHPKYKDCDSLGKSYRQWSSTDKNDVEVWPNGSIWIQAEYAIITIIMTMITYMIIKNVMIKMKMLQGHFTQSW